VSYQPVVQGLEQQEDVVAYVVVRQRGVQDLEVLSAQWGNLLDVNVDGDSMLIHFKYQIVYGIP